MQKPIEYAQTLFTVYGEQALVKFINALKVDGFFPGQSAQWTAEVIRILVANETTPILA